MIMVLTAFRAAIVGDTTFTLLRITKLQLLISTPMFPPFMFTLVIFAALGMPPLH